MALKYSNRDEFIQHADRLNLKITPVNPPVTYMEGGNVREMRLWLGTKFVSDGAIDLYEPGLRGFGYSLTPVDAEGVPISGATDVFVGEIHKSDLHQRHFIIQSLEPDVRTDIRYKIHSVGYVRSSDLVTSV